MKRREFLSVGLAGAAVFVGGRFGIAEGVAGRKKPFILGADVSWLLEDEAQGATYWDRGVQKDLLAILKAYGFNTIRARIFVNPHGPGGYSARRDEAFCDLEHTKKFATRIKAAGMRFLLSYHYGDTWTSPGAQAKPAAWAGLPYDQLVKTVHEWTGEVLKGLGANGTPPQMVSVGNETTGGMLFPEGKASNFDRFAELTNAGCLAVREFDKSIPVALHNHLGRDNEKIRWWVDNFLKRKTEFDVIGMSCYNQAHEGDWEKNFNDLAVRYPQLSFAAMEYSYRKRHLNDLIFKAPNEKGLGSFIWEPTRWREAIFDHNGENAGDDMGNRAHLPASTLPAVDAGNQPVYRAADPELQFRDDDLPATRPVATRPAGTGSAGTGPAATQGTRRRLNRGGKYETNSYILAYPEMAKAYGLG